MKFTEKKVLIAFNHVQSFLPLFIMICKINLHWDAIFTHQITKIPPKWEQYVGKALGEQEFSYILWECYEWHKHCGGEFDVTQNCI